MTIKDFENVETSDGSSGTQASNDACPEQSVWFHRAAVTSFFCGLFGGLVSVVMLAVLAHTRVTRTEIFVQYFSPFLIPIPIILILGTLSSTFSFGHHPAILGDSCDPTGTYVAFGIMSFFWLSTTSFPFLLGRVNYEVRIISEKTPPDTPAAAAAKRQSWGGVEEVSPVVSNRPSVDQIAGGGGFSAVVPIQQDDPLVGSSSSGTRGVLKTSSIYEQTQVHIQQQQKQIDEQRILIEQQQIQINHQLEVASTLPHQVPATPASPQSWTDLTPVHSQHGVMASNSATATNQAQHASSHSSDLGLTAIAAVPVPVPNSASSKPKPPPIETEPSSQSVPSDAKAFEDRAAQNNNSVGTAISSMQQDQTASSFPEASVGMDSQNTLVSDDGASARMVLGGRADGGRLSPSEAPLQKTTSAPPPQQQFFSPSHKVPSPTHESDTSKRTSPKSETGSTGAAELNNEFANRQESVDAMKELFGTKAAAENDGGKRGSQSKRHSAGAKRLSATSANEHGSGGKRGSLGRRKSQTRKKSTRGSMADMNLCVSREATPPTGAEPGEPSLLTIENKIAEQMQERKRSIHSLSRRASLEDGQQPKEIAAAAEAGEQAQAEGAAVDGEAMVDRPAAIVTREESNEPPSNQISQIGSRAASEDGASVSSQVIAQSMDAAGTGNRMSITVKMPESPVSKAGIVDIPMNSPSLLPGAGEMALSAPPAKTLGLGKGVSPTAKSATTGGNLVVGGKKINTEKKKKDQPNGMDESIPMLPLSAVNWDNCLSASESSDGYDTESEYSDGEEYDDFEELWDPMDAEAVEVPTWLLDRLKQSGWQAPPDAAPGGPTQMIPAMVPAPAGAGLDRRRSSIAHGFGNATNLQGTAIGEGQQDAMKRKRSRSFANIYEDPQGQGPLQAMRDRSGSTIAHPTLRRGSQLFPTFNPTAGGGPGFWKIPMPSRRASVQVSRRGSQAIDPTTGMPERKKSVLYMMEQQEEANKFALPDRKNSVVDIRKSSVVMSGAVIRDLLETSIDASRITKNTDGDGDAFDMEISLPNFRPKQKFIPQYCKCPKDPVTGKVNHTCMTPAATMAANSAFQSYVCSEWGTRAQSTWASRRASDNIIIEEGDEEEEEDEGEVNESPTSSASQQQDPAPMKTLQMNPPKKKQRNLNSGANKRIRNASMLASAVGGIGGESRQDPEEGVPEHLRGNLHGFGAITEGEEDEDAYEEDEEGESDEDADAELKAQVGNALAAPKGEQQDHSRVSFSVSDGITGGGLQDPDAAAAGANKTTRASVSSVVSGTGSVTKRSYHMGQRPSVSKRDSRLSIQSIPDKRFSSSTANVGPRDQGSLVGIQQPRGQGSVSLREQGSLRVSVPENRMSINSMQASQRGNAMWDPAKDELSVSVRTKDNEAIVEDSMSQRFESIDPLALVDFLANYPNTWSQILIVDVRGRDHAGGHIPSSINMKTYVLYYNILIVLQFYY